MPTPTCLQIGVISTWRSIVQPGTPVGGDDLPGCYPVNTVAGVECVRWAGHRFHTQALAATVRAEGVAGVELNKGVTVVDPQLGAAPVWPVQPYPRSADLVPGKVGKGEVDALIAQLA